MRHGRPHQLKAMYLQLLVPCLLACSILALPLPFDRGEALAGVGSSADTSARPVHVTHTNPNELIIDPRNPLGSPGMVDCNWNGIPDSLDIAEGTSDDDNHNGVIDECESDTTLCWNRQDCRDRWRDLASRADTSFFWTAHAPNGTVVIRFTVPRAGASVGLTAHGETTGKRFTVIDTTRKATGAYELSWDKRDSQTHVAAPAGIYTLTLKVGTRSYLRRVHWANL